MVTQYLFSGTNVKLEDRQINSKARWNVIRGLNKKLIWQNLAYLLI